MGCAQRVQLIVHVPLEYTLDAKVLIHDFPEGCFTNTVLSPHLDIPAKKYYHAEMPRDFNMPEWKNDTVSLNCASGGVYA